MSNNLEAKLSILCQCGKPSIAGSPIKPPCFACEALARINELEKELAETKENLADTKADLYRIHAALMDLKYGPVSAVTGGVGN